MTVAFLGPLPPPVHGFAAINAAMLKLLQARCDVEIFDRAPSKSAAGLIGVVQGVWKWSVLWAKFVVMVVLRRPNALYVGFSGGYGQLLDAPFFIIARLAAIRLFVHHHSFAYINRRSPITALCVRLLGNATHIVLCREMAAGLNSCYEISASRCRILSNTAYLQKPDATGAGQATDAMAEQPHAVRVGFLSNITAEKGIFEFFDVLLRAHASGLPFSAVIAGPISEKIKREFFNNLGRLSEVEYVGAVYDDKKQLFYSSIDLLLFPTRYPNEAEPLTLIEAQSAGVKVLAAARGCISGMLEGSGCCGVAVPIENFCTASVEEISELASLTKAARVQLRRDISHQFAIKHQQCAAVLTALVDEIAGDVPFTIELQH